jgi:hypothetical protein
MDNVRRQVTGAIGFWSYGRGATEQLRPDWLAPSGFGSSLAASQDAAWAGLRPLLCRSTGKVVGGTFAPPSCDGTYGGRHHEAMQEPHSPQKRRLAPGPQPSPRCPVGTSHRGGGGNVMGAEGAEIDLFVDGTNGSIELLSHPLPSSPVKGGGADRGCGSIAITHRPAPSPLRGGLGRAGAGWDAGWMLEPTGEASLGSSIAQRSRSILDG